MQVLSRTLSPFSNYEHYRHQIQNGDVIAFSGSDISSDIIKQATHSHYSHVGIVLDVNMDGAFGQSILIVESTTEVRQRDAFGKQVIKGVQIHFLSTRLEMYEGDVWWVPQREKLSSEGLAKMQAWLRQTYNQKVPYDYVQVCGAGLDEFDGLGCENKRDFSSLFCSELVTKALQEAGVVSSDINPSEQTPQNVVTFPCCKEPVLLKQLEQDEFQKQQQLIEVGV